GAGKSVGKRDIELLLAGLFDEHCRRSLRRKAGADLCRQREEEKGEQWPGHDVAKDIRVSRRCRGSMRRIRKAFKHLRRRAGIDIRFIPELGFDAYADLRKLAATD